MDDLKSIWNQVSCDSEEYKVKLTDSKESIFDKLRKEQILRDKFNPLLIGFIVLFTLVFSFVVLYNDSSFIIPKIIGILCMILASISIAVFSQIIKMPLHQFEHDKSSMMFLKIVKDKLNESKKMLILSLFLQIFFMTVGLYLIIFYGSIHSNLGYFFGFMFAMGGASIGGGISFFNTHYKSTYHLINQFLNE